MKCFLLLAKRNILYKKKILSNDDCKCLYTNFCELCRDRLCVALRFVSFIFTFFVDICTVFNVSITTQTFLRLRTLRFYIFYSWITTSIVASSNCLIYTSGYSTVVQREFTYIAYALYLVVYRTATSAHVGGSCFSGLQGDAVVV